MTDSQRKAARHAARAFRSLARALEALAQPEEAIAPDAATAACEPTDLEIAAARRDLRRMDALPAPTPTQPRRPRRPRRAG